MWLQSLVVFVVVACCVVFVARSLWRKVAGRSDGCGGCGGCNKPAQKGCAFPYDGEYANDKPGSTAQ